MALVKAKKVEAFANKIGGIKSVDLKGMEMLKEAARCPLCGKAGKRMWNVTATNGRVYQVGMHCARGVAEFIGAGKTAVKAEAAPAALVTPVAAAPVVPVAADPGKTEGAPSSNL